MRLDLRNPAQADICKRAIVTLDGVQQTMCHIADSDHGFVEVFVLGHSSVCAACTRFVEALAGADGDVLRPPLLAQR